ncbi:unnamed protein product, partial [marine sediment metagenome]
SDKVQENLRSAIGGLQVWDDIITEAVKKDGFEAAAERIMAQVCADLEPVRKMGPLYKYITEVATPLSIAGYLKYYQKKHRVG